MSKDFVSGWYENSWLTGGTALAHAVTYNSGTGAFSADGAVISPALPITWANFILLDWTQLNGILYQVTDVHSVGSTGGSLWMADAVGDRPILISAPLQYATLALAPSPITYPGLRIFPANVGAVCKSDGATYRLENTSVMISNTLADINHGGTFTTEALIKSIQIPVDINNKSLVQDGDVIIVYEAWCQKTGVVNIITRRYLLGTSTTVGDYVSAATGEVLTTTEASAPVIGRCDNDMRILRLSATTVRIDGVIVAGGSLNVGGPNTVARNTTVTTTTSLDSATPPSLHYGLKLNGTTDTGLMLLRGYRVGIERGY